MSCATTRARSGGSSPPQPRAWQRQDALDPRSHNPKHKSHTRACQRRGTLNPHPQTLTSHTQELVKGERQSTLNLQLQPRTRASRKPRHLISHASNDPPCPLDSMPSSGRCARLPPDPPVYPDHRCTLYSLLIHPYIPITGAHCTDESRGARPGKDISKTRNHQP